MTEIELNELPRGVRERFADIKDAQFDDHPLVMAARERLDEHQDRHAECVERVIKIKTRIEQLRSKQVDAREELKAISERRPELIATLLQAGDDLSADRKAKARIDELSYFLEATDKGLPALNKYLDKEAEACRNAAISLQADEEHIRGVLDELKLEEAKRLAYE